MKQEEFWGHVARGQFCFPLLSFCWEWQGRKTTKGYGQFSLRGRETLAHRTAWELTNGAIPKGDGYHGLCVLHKCDNPSCVRPSHLKLGTQAENMKDMARKGRGKGGILPGENHGTVKLTEAQVKEIRAKYSAGNITQSQLASCYGVSRSCVKNITSGVNWKDVQP